MTTEKTCKSKDSDVGRFISLSKQYSLTCRTYIQNVSEFRYSLHSLKKQHCCQLPDLSLKRNSIILRNRNLCYVIAACAKFYFHLCSCFADCNIS